MAEQMVFASAEEQRRWAQADDTSIITSDDTATMTAQDAMNIVAAEIMEEEAERFQKLRQAYRVVCEGAGHNFESDELGEWRDMLSVAIELNWSAEKLTRRCLEVVANS